MTNTAPKPLVSAPKFFDPMFAVATAILALMMFPIWVLVMGDVQVGLYVTGGFALVMLAGMLWVSWSIAHERIGDSQ